MKTSTDRLLTTHIGSLPRPDDLLKMIVARDAGEAVDEAAFDKRVRAAIRESLERQARLGIDVVADGEMARLSFVTYVESRLGGYSVEGTRPLGWAGSREMRDFPEYYAATQGTVGSARARPQYVCTGPVSYIGREALDADLARIKAGLEGLGVAEAFYPSISPTNVENQMPNRYYKTDEEYLFAVADAMHEEYQAVVESGLLLQIDDPRLATYYCFAPDRTLEECRSWAARHVETLNHALRGIPEDRIRFHTCYSINMGPRVHDMELKDLVDIMLRINAQGYSFEAANPRHDHEWKVWKDVKLPDDKVLIPGVITNSSVLVEHPELVAERLGRFASVVGKERVIAGADCGFASFATSNEMHPSIVWAKLAAMVEGAKIASKELWG